MPAAGVKDRGGWPIKAGSFVRVVAGYDLIGVGGHEDRYRMLVTGFQDTEKHGRIVLGREVGTGGFTCARPRECVLIAKDRVSETDRLEAESWFSRRVPAARRR